MPHDAAAVATAGHCSESAGLRLGVKLSTTVRVSGKAAAVPVARPPSIDFALTHPQ
jgi:hypothetical protein